jgi:hypothetical protein
MEVFRIPEPVLPETVLPETELPETELPETVLSETVLPETELPETELPETELPETELPEFTIKCESNNFEVHIPLNIARKFITLSNAIDDLNTKYVTIPKIYTFENEDEFKTFFEMVKEASENEKKKIDLNKHINNDIKKAVRFIKLINFLDYDILYRQFIEYFVILIK